MKTPLNRISTTILVFTTAIIMALFGVFGANANTYYARANGDWNVNTTWSLSSGGPAVEAGIWPVAGDNVYISDDGVAFTVTIPAGYSAACANIYMGTANAVAATLNLATATSSLSVSGNVIVYGPLGGATRSINADGGTITIGGNLELNNGQTAANGNRVCRLSVTTGTVTVSGNLVFNNIATSANNQAQIVMSAGSGTFNLAGAFNIVNAHGTLTAGTTSTFNFNGSVSGQSIPIGVAAVVYNNININNIHSSGATLSAAVTATNVTGNISIQSGTLNNGGFAITLASTKNFSVSNGATFNLTGTSTMPTVSGGGTKTFGANSTVSYAGTNQAVTAETYGNIIFGDGGTKTLPISTLTVAGNWTNNSTALNAGTGSVAFNGSEVQTIGGSSSTSFFNLTLDNAAGLTLGANITVTNALVLSNGILSTGTFTLFATNTAPSAIGGMSSSNYISGNLLRGIAAGANTYEFPIGTANFYAPVSITFSAETTDGSLKAFTTDGDHLNLSSSSFTPETTVNRHWTFSVMNGIGSAPYDAVFNWAHGISGEEDPGFNYNYAYVQKYSVDTWTQLSEGTVTNTSAQILGVTGFSDFQVGNGCTNPPVATISGSGTICAGDAVQVQVDLTGSFPWSYTWSDGTNSGTVSDVTTSPSFFTVYPAKSSTYSISSVYDAVGCLGTGIGSASYITGPSVSLPNLVACPGYTLSIPVTVNSFTNVGAISLILNYDKSAMTYVSYTDNSGMIDYLFNDISGTLGAVKISGITAGSYSLNDGDILLTLNFTYLGGATNLTWDDSGDGTQCEFSTGAPDFIPYCDIPRTSYYQAGSITETSLTAEFSADNLTPPRNTIVSFTDLSIGDVTGWTWTFDRPSVIFVGGTSEHSQNPQVQFTDGGLYTVTLTVTKTNCSVSEIKTGYIRVGLPGIWTGTANSDWYTIANWDDQFIPDGSIDVSIGTVASGNYPYLMGDLTTTAHCRNITVTGIASLTVKGLLTIHSSTSLQIQNGATVITGAIVNP